MPTNDITSPHLYYMHKFVMIVYITVQYFVIKLVQILFKQKGSNLLQFASVMQVNNQFLSGSMEVCLQDNSIVVDMAQNGEKWIGMKCSIDH